MKKGILLLLLGTAVLFSPVVTWGKAAAASDSTWEYSIQGWDCRGIFDYYLYDFDASSMISKVSFPQKQKMVISNLKYTLPHNYGSLSLQYGKTGINLKGRGSDSDWASTNPSTLTDYGEFDTFGAQQLFSISFGKTMIDIGRFSAGIFTGWSRNKTTNELKNVTYYLVDGASYDGISQSDLGSTLDAEFSGWHLGVNDKIVFGTKFALCTEFTVRFLKTKAAGCWNNHSPAWKWTNTGNTIGYNANLALQYEISRSIDAELGYYYNYARSTDCEEVLNGQLLAEPVALKYKQQGFYLGVNLVF